MPSLMVLLGEGLPVRAKASSWTRKVKPAQAANRRHFANSWLLSWPRTVPAVVKKLVILC